MVKPTKEQVREERLRRVKVELSMRKFQHFSEYTANYNKIRTKWNMSLCTLLDLVRERKVLFLFLEVSPRWGKTEDVARSFPAYVLGHDPKQKLVVASYAQTLATKSSRKARELTKTARFQDVFPDFKLADDKKEGHNWETSEGGFYYAVGLGGTLTGEGFDIGIIDDYVKNRQDAESLTIRESTWDWYTSTFLTRDEESIQKRTAKIVFATRWNIDDLGGRILEKAKKNGDKIVEVDFKASKEELIELVEREGRDCIYRMKVPALDDDGESNFPERFSTEQLKSKRKDLGVRDWSALYMQDPVNSTGATFKKEDFRYFALSDFEKVEARVRKEDLELGIFVDPAFSSRSDSDDAVIMAVARHIKTKELFVLDIAAGTFPPSVGTKIPVNMALKWKAKGFRVGFISVEDVTINKDQSLFLEKVEEEMRSRGAIFTLHKFTPKGKKEDRIRFNIEPYTNRNAIYFRCDEDTEVWIKLEEQLLKFPVSNHDDLSDTLAQAVEVFDEWGHSTEDEQFDQYLDEEGNMI